MSLLTNITIDNTDTENVLAPFQDILPTDTFNDWRRKTNGLKLLLDEFAEGVNDSTITITTSNGLTGASNFTLNQATTENINLAVDTNVIATKSFVSDSVGTGVVTLQPGVGITIVGDRNIDLNANSNKTITINSDATADITDIVGYTGELFQTAYFTGANGVTEFSLQDQPGFQDPISPFEHKPITTRPGGFIVTIDGVYQIPGDNGELNQAPDEGAYWIRDNGDDTYDLVFVEAPPADSKICISSVISYNDKLGVNNSTITLSGTGAISGGGSFDLNQEAAETLPSFTLNIDTGLLTQAGGNLTLSNFTAKRVLGNLGTSSAKPSQITVDAAAGGLTANDNHLATSAAIKDYVDSNGITQSTGPAPYYGVRAWCHYNGSSQVIHAQGNIASVTRHNTGDYEFFFTEEMPSSSYAISLSYSNEVSGAIHVFIGQQHTVGFIVSHSTTSFRVQHYAVSSSAHPTDKSYVGVSVIC